MRSIAAVWNAMYQNAVMRILSSWGEKWNPSTIIMVSTSCTWFTNPANMPMNPAKMTRKGVYTWIWRMTVREVLTSHTTLKFVSRLPKARMNVTKRPRAPINPSFPMGICSAFSTMFWTCSVGQSRFSISSNIGR